MSRRVHILFYTCIENEGLVWCSACVFFTIFIEINTRASLYIPLNIVNYYTMPTTLCTILQLKYIVPNII